MGLQEEMVEIRKQLNRIISWLERIYLLLQAEKEREMIIKRIKALLPHVTSEADAKKLLSLLSQVESGRGLSDKQMKMLWAIENEYGNKAGSRGKVSRSRGGGRRNTGNNR